MTRLAAPGIEAARSAGAEGAATGQGTDRVAVTAKDTNDRATHDGASSPGADAATLPGRATVFLSYARADKDRAVQLRRGLQAAGLEVWWDTMIEGGAEFARTIEAALHTCDAVVVVWSRASVGSDWVLDEAAKGATCASWCRYRWTASSRPWGSVAITRSTSPAGTAASSRRKCRPSCVASGRSTGAARRPRSRRPRHRTRLRPPRAPPAGAAAGVPLRESPERSSGGAAPMPRRARRATASPYCRSRT